MSNKSFSENELIIEERSHSYEFYKGKIKGFYDKFKMPPKMAPKKADPDSFLYSFSDVLERACKGAYTPAGSDENYIYNSYRMMLFKNLNLSIQNLEYMVFVNLQR